MSLDFTYSTDATRPSLLKPSDQVPVLDMVPVVWPIATIMGFFNRVNEMDIPVNVAWHPNDGVVNTKSMAGPTVCVVYGPTSNPTHTNMHHSIGGLQYDSSIPLHH